MSSSVMRSTRFQSVWDRGEIAAFFTACRLSYRDDPNDFIRFRVDHGHDPAFQESESNKASLAIAKSLVFNRDRVPFEEGLNVDEVNTMLP